MTEPGRLERSMAPRRTAGIALLVVMIAFVVLYLVVYQLHFSTSMEERVAQVRYGAVESTIATHSVALYVLTLLVEDLKAGMSQAQGGTTSAASPSSAASPRAAGGATPTPAGAAGATMMPLATSMGSSTSSSSKWYDHLHKNIFSDNRQQVGDVSVKINVVDGERAFDLNRLFDYVRLPGEDLAAGVQDLREEDLVAAAGKDEKEAESSLRLQLLNRTSKSKKTTSSGGAASDTTGGVRRVGAGEESGGTGIPEVDEAMSEYEPDETFEPPDELRLQATRDMVERAILMMFSVNENDYGYRYSQRYSASEIAGRIVDYVLERRGAAGVGRIYLITELLNVAGVTREVFYGPTPEIQEGEDVYVGQGFVLRKDEFGDVFPEYMQEFEDPYLEEQKRMVEDLQRQFGAFKDFPGLGRLQSNALTRGMTEPATALDEYGEEYAVEVPKAIGLRDIFTTYSTGKINLNTASVPVTYALLLSLTEDEANKVALDIRDYRNRFQEEIDEEGVQRVDSATPDLGQPKRQKKTTEETSGTAGTTGGISGTSKATSAYDPTSEEALGVSTYEDMETNYFTSLEQLELIDGVDEGPNDLLRRSDGVQRVDAEDDSLFRRVQNDIEKVAVFGSTYFHAELKAKAKDGTVAKAGYLTVKRDPEKKRIEVVMWKNLQK